LLEGELGEMARLNIVPVDADAVLIHEAELGLGGGVSVLGGASQQSNGLVVAPVDTFASKIEISEWRISTRRAPPEKCAFGWSPALRTAVVRRQRFQQHHGRLDWACAPHIRR
jgi:hypothetical protein